MHHLVLHLQFVPRRHVVRRATTIGRRLFAPQANAHRDLAPRLFTLQSSHHRGHLPHDQPCRSASTSHPLAVPHLPLRRHTYSFELHEPSDDEPRHEEYNGLEGYDEYEEEEEGAETERNRVSNEVAMRAVNGAITQARAAEHPAKAPVKLPFPLALPPPGYTAPGSTRRDGRMTSDLKRQERNGDEGIWKVPRKEALLDQRTARSDDSFEGRGYWEEAEATPRELRMITVGVGCIRLEVGGLHTHP